MVFNGPLTLTKQALLKARAQSVLRAISQETGVAFSVLIATRNRASYLDLCLYSLGLERLPTRFWEVLVLDNASQDSTSDVLDKYETRGLPLRRYYIREP